MKYEACPKIAWLMLFFYFPYVWILQNFWNVEYAFVNRLGSVYNTFSLYFTNYWSFNAFGISDRRKPKKRFIFIGALQLCLPL